MAKKETTTKVVKEETRPEPEPVKESETDQKQIKAIEKVIESKIIAPQDAFGKLTRPQIDLIKKTIAKGSSDDELKLFIQVCKGAQLNPFLKQVFLVPRWDSRTGNEVRAIQVSIDGFRSIAESSGAYAGNDDPVFDGDQEIAFETTQNKQQYNKKLTVPLKATVTVYKMVEGQRYPFTATARWAEYYPGAKMGFQWHVRPYLMLGKCAEALALRKAFPKLLSGMYAQEEIEQGVSEEEKQQQESVKAFETLKKVIKTATDKELKEYQTKMAGSDKYTPEQKKEFSALVEARTKEIKKPVDKKDDAPAIS